MARTHGRTAIDRALFSPTSSAYSRFIAQRDLPEFGVRAGEEVSRRKAIETSQGGKRLETQLEWVPRNWREKVVARVYEREHGSRRGLAKVLRELNQVRPTGESKKGIRGQAERILVERWTAILQKHGLWESMSPEEIHEFFDSPEEEIVGKVGE